MLKRVTIAGVGPADRFDLEAADRLTLITGDNGLGKSFLLDTAWWVCARDWPEQPAVPNASLTGRGSPADAWIQATIGGITKPAEVPFRYRPDLGDWKRNGKGRPPIAGLLVYSRVDGGFSVWDPARHYYRRLPSTSADSKDRIPAFHFPLDKVWKGMDDDLGNTICRGLLVDWPDWQRSSPDTFRVFQDVLLRLSPPGDPITPADRTIRLPGPGVDRIPALQTARGPVPITLASAGLRRIVALAYLIVWAWVEHKAAATANGQAIQQQLIILIDEIESHLHPKWQRRILPALLDVAAALDAQVACQFIVATHSPLVMASAEPVFQPGRDKLYHLRQADGTVALDEVPWVTRGDVGAWLVSDIFGLESDRSEPATDAIRAAQALMEGRMDDLPPELPDEAAIRERLIDLLPGTDPFWAQWRRFELLRTLGPGTP